MSVTIGANDYRHSAQKRLHQAGILLEDGCFAGAVYLGGRAVEWMLSALIWKHDSKLRAGQKSLDTGHDLRDMLSLVRNLGILRENEKALAEGVQRIGRLWFNNMRFVSTDKLKTLWWTRGEIRGKRTLKLATRDFYDDCSGVVKRCEVFYEKA